MKRSRSIENQLDFYNKRKELLDGAQSRVDILRDVLTGAIVYRITDKYKSELMSLNVNPKFVPYIQAMTRFYKSDDLQTPYIIDLGSHALQLHDRSKATIFKGKNTGAEIGLNRVELAKCEDCFGAVDVTKANKYIKDAQERINTFKGFIRFITETEKTEKYAREALSVINNIDVFLETSVANKYIKKKKIQKKK